MAFDFKKEYKDFYIPKNKPAIVNVPKMNYIAIRGKGNPNEEGGEYKTAIGVLYAIAYTIKMSKMGEHRIDGYFDYVVPPLEGFWWQKGIDGVDYSHKESFCWISAIRLPDFVTKAEFDWAVKTAEEKKKIDCSRAEFLTIEEGLCVQIMHNGSYDDEPASIELMNSFIAENGCENDFSDTDKIDTFGGILKNRLHHEVYLSDPRKCAVEKLKTVIRHPIKNK
ncbi:MAG: GyrI-like domain-containing protein [Treponema sp.]|nr:GyrI-like domain-containing protein [Candidatus Treponema caballi]